MAKTSEGRAIAALRSDEFEQALSENLRALQQASERPTRAGGPRIRCIGETHGSHFLNASSATLGGTGALLLELPGSYGTDVLLDPGWGTLVAARRSDIHLDDVGIVLVSHAHLDHTGDLAAVLLWLGLNGIRPSLVANTTTLFGAKGQPPVLSQFFLDKCDHFAIAESGQLSGFESLHLRSFFTKHRETAVINGQSLAFVVDLLVGDAGRVGLVTDGPLNLEDRSFISALRECTTLIVNLGTMSLSPGSPFHNHTFDNALCLSGLEDLLKSMAAEPCELRRLAVTHLGAEVLEPISDPMRRFLAEYAASSPIDLLAPALTGLVRQELGSDVETVVLREGDAMEL